MVLPSPSRRLDLETEGHKMFVGQCSVGVESSGEVDAFANPETLLKAFSDHVRPDWDL